MLKSISNLGAILNKAEQKTINGGQIQCGRNEVLRCNWLGCWCESTLPQEDVKDM